MPVVDLILAVCLVADPTACRDEHLYFDSRGSLHNCMIEALPTMAAWAGTHPGWRIARFHCEWANDIEEET